MNRGALYIATKLEDSNPYAKRGDILKMAMHSIDSLRKVSKLPITLLTNAPCNRTDINVVQIQSLNTERDYTKDKTFYTQQTPYESTIFLDADTEILEDPEPLFNTDYDFLMPYIPNCDYENKVWRGYRENGYGTGTFLYNKNQITDLIFERSKEQYRQMEIDPSANIGSRKNYISDQKALNTAIKQSVNTGVVIKPLHPKWVGIPPVVQFVDDVAILHVGDLHKGNRDWLLQRKTGWTMDNDTLLDDLLLWRQAT